MRSTWVQHYQRPIPSHPSLHLSPTMTIAAIPTSEQELTKLMHGKSATKRNAFLSMLRKDGQAHRLVTDEYVKRWTEDSDEARKSRQDSYMSLVNKYVLSRAWLELHHI